jgi:glycosyltransferase involved in cell wall biosynthesis
MRARFGAYVAIEHLEPPVMPPRGRVWQENRLLPRLGLWWYRWKLRGYTRSLCPAVTVCVSDAVRRRLTSDYHFPAHKLMTVRNGIDPALFRPDAGARTAARDSWQIPPGGFVFGFAGRLVGLKAVDVILDAFAAARQAARRPLRLVIAGDGPERLRLEEQAAHLGIGSAVRFLGFEPRPWEVYPGFDVLLLPSRVEACPVTAIEAMACGCEVIASSVGGIPEIIADGIVGTLVPPDDAGALREAMVRAERRAEADRMPLLARARAHVIEHFNRRVQYRRISSVVADLAHAPGRTGSVVSTKSASSL